MTVNQAAENRNVFRCFLKTESELQSRMFDGRQFQITVPSKKKNAERNQWPLEEVWEM